MPDRALERASWIAAAVHLAAGLAMALVLDRGLAVNPDLSDRLRFLSDNRGPWLAGWALWNAAALSIFYYYACFIKAHGLPAWLLVVSGLAVACDLTAEAVEMFVLPGLALQALSGSPHAVGAFLESDRFAVLLTGGLANALYTFVACVLAARARSSYPTWVSAAAAGVGLGGAGLSLAALADSAQGLYAANVLLLPCLLAWQAGVAWTARRGLN